MRRPNMKWRPRLKHLDGMAWAGSLEALIMDRGKREKEFTLI